MCIRDRLIFLVIRGLSASIRSVVFDSTIRYFKEPNILPDLPSLAMNLNLLLLSFAVILIINGLINLILKFLNIDLNKSDRKKFFAVLSIVAIIIFISFFISKDPLITPVILLIILLLLFLISFQTLIKNKNSKYIYLLILLVGSVISIVLLNYFNTKLERESLKTTAWEINLSLIHISEPTQPY